MLRNLLALGFAFALVVAGARPAVAEIDLGEDEPEWAGWTGSTEIESPDPRFYVDPAGDPQPKAEKRWSVWGNVPVFVHLPNFNAVITLEELPVDVNLTHRGILDLVLNDLSNYVAYAGGFRYDRFHFDFDLFYIQFKRVDLEDLGKQVPDPFIFDMSMKLDFLWLHPSFSYTLIDREVDFGIFNRVRFDALVGLQYFWYRMKARITDGFIQAEIGKTIIDDSEHYWTFLPVGAQIEFGLLDNVSWISRIMIGGWGIGSAGGGTDGYALSTFRYHLNEHFTFDFGVRWQDLNMEGDKIDVEAKDMWGPFVGFAFHY